MRRRAAARAASRGRRHHPRLGAAFRGRACGAALLSSPPMRARDFDLVLFGASGFTGRLVAEVLHAWRSGGGALRWALAGRDPARLAAVRDALGAGEALPLLWADARDAAALARLAARTRAIPDSRAGTTTWARDGSCAWMRSPRRARSRCRSSCWPHVAAADLHAPNRRFVARSDRPGAFGAPGRSSYADPRGELWARARSRIDRVGASGRSLEIRPGSSGPRAHMREVGLCAVSSPTSVKSPPSSS